MKHRYVSVSQESIATLDDVVQLLSRMTYSGLLALAELIGGDADKIADAIHDYAPEDEAE